MQHFAMAWRIDEQVVRGEIDNRTRGRVVGRLWMIGREDPVELDLEGNPWRDLAGHVLRFSNPDAKPGDLAGFNPVQNGQVGDLTASRKVKVPDCSMEELKEYHKAKQLFPWHWGNALYLEWFSGTNGQVVIESASYQLVIDTEAAWTMDEAGEAAQRAENERGMMAFFEKLNAAVDAMAEEVDENEPQSLEEARADADDARMTELSDRIAERLRREGHADFERIHREERERMKRERGEAEEEASLEQQAERANWIEEMNAIAKEALENMESEKWKGGDALDYKPHPLVAACADLGVNIHMDIRAGKWLPETAQEEHPLHEISFGVSNAAAKMAGALSMGDDKEWPPEPLIAGYVIVRLKKAIASLRDALAGLDSADEDGLATPEWRREIRKKVEGFLAEARVMLAEARSVLDVDDDDLGIF
jgi:hypothetical protein